MSDRKYVPNEYSYKGDNSVQYAPQEQITGRKREEKSERKRQGSTDSDDQYPASKNGAYANGKGTKVNEKDVNEKLPYHHLSSANDAALQFTSFPEILPATRECLNKNGITQLFPIQAQTFHPIYNGQDVLARDLTGSGKTLAFSLPLIEKFRKEGRLSGKNRQVLTVVLAPTRELAI